MPNRTHPEKPLTPLAHGALNQCFGCGLENRTGLRLRFFTDQDNNVLCHLRLAARFAGPPGHAHGGIIATLLDEAMSKSNRARGILAMTRHLEIDYLRPVPLGVPLTLSGRHTGTTGRRNHVEGQLADDAGNVLATAKAVFVTVTPDLLQKATARNAAPTL
ncbi:MAG: PaaI family thioesterase [Acidobacteriaceae bacterium]|jgi:uncharacterized protein (TIGR00369 family)